MNDVGNGWGTYTVGVAILLLVWQLATTIVRRRFLLSSLLHDYLFRSPQMQAAAHHLNTSPVSPPSPPSPPRISEIITDLDLKSLMDSLDEELHEVEKWDIVMDRTNDSFSYNVKCCKPKDSPVLYLSMTVFEGCSAEILRDFYMDNYYRKEWDKTLIEHEQLEVDERNGTEIGRTIKKFPLLTPREYILAWRLWEGSDGAYYCYSKDCEHPIAFRQKRYVRVGFFRSGWRIKKGKFLAQSFYSCCF